MSNISEWSTSAASNQQASPDGWPEGMPPASVNDAARENMAAVARWYGDTDGTLTTAGSGNSFTLATNSSFTALADISFLAFRVDRANTGAATLKVDTTTAKSLRSAGSALISGQLVADSIVTVSYNSTDDVFDIHSVIKIDAADLVGKIADARLSNNVPLKDVENTFTGSRINISNSAPAIRWDDTSQAANTGLWQALSNSGVWRLDSLNDAGASLSKAINIAHDGTLMEFSATSITLNGKEGLTETVINGLTAIDVSGLAATDGVYIDDNGAAKRMAVQDMGLRFVSADANQTFALGDANSAQAVGATARTYTVPANSSVAFPVGCTIGLVSTGAGTITIDPASGVTINSVIAQGSTANRTVLAGGMALLYKVGTDAWNLTGDIG